MKNEKVMCESMSPFFFIEKFRSSKNVIHLFFVLFQTQIFCLIGQKQFGEQNAKRTRVSHIFSIRCYALCCRRIHFDYRRLI